jgi:hypothetical protein
MISKHGGPGKEAKGESGFTMVTVPRTRWALLALLFFGAVLLFFCPSFSNYFVCDDYEFLGRINLHNAGDYFLKSWGYGNEYRPLLVYTYALNGALGAFHPAGYHLVNTALHALNGILLALILELLGFPPIAALLAAVLFVLNPVAHESVLWIAGRPVVLSTLFILLSIWSFLKAVARPQRSAIYFAGMYAAFVLALLVYEGAAVVPFLIALLGGIPNLRRHRWQMVGLLGVLLAYLVFWNVLFGFRITRFPTEHSFAAALSSLRNAAENSFHGSGRLWAAPLYLGLLWFALREKAGRIVLLLASGWFLLAYTPFLVVHGYADRFSYLGSAAMAAVLAYCLAAISRANAWAGRMAALALILFYAIGMQHRIATWAEAGEIARSIVAEVKQARPSLPQGATLILLDAPLTYKQASVFITGLERAVALQYPNTRLLILRRTRADAPRPVAVFAYRDGHMRETAFLP